MRLWMRIATGSTSGLLSGHRKMLAEAIPKNRLLVRGGGLQWIMQGGMIVSDCLKGQRQAIDALSQGFLEGVQHQIHRLPIALPRHGLDAVSPQHFASIDRAVQQQYGPGNGSFLEACRTLVEIQSKRCDVRP